MNLQLPVTSSTHKGLRPYQEDRLIIATYEQGFLLGVFDGHGGADTAHLASEEIPGYFADEITEEGATPKTALENAIRKVVIQTQSFGPGSTLSLAWIPAKGDTVTCAVIGDSPIIVKDADGKINISPEHNVRTNYEERRAAEARGGFVSDGYLFQSYSGMGLQMARALGDTHLDKVLSRVPDIYEVKVGAGSFVIVASDGSFDPGHYGFEKAAEEVVKLVEGGGDAKAIVDRAVKIKTGDNTTAIVARFEDGVSA